jgi:peptidyl-tRNA hydrolase
MYRLPARRGGTAIRQHSRVTEVDPAAVSAYRDPPGEAPWAMPIVVRVEKGAEPTAVAVAEATATAVVRVLADPRSTDGEWAAAVSRWLDGRIRKVARRARGSRWTAAQTLPGVTVVHDGAEVRAFVPTATDAVPPEIAKLQVSGLELPPGEPTPPRAGALSIALTPHVTMSPLKAAVQAGHAAQLAYHVMSDDQLSSWREAGFDVRVCYPDAAAWARLASSARVVVRDAGFTEIPPGTRTALALC